MDDVAEQSADGKTKVGQSKSALTDNPVADRALSLWKTIFNWHQLVVSGYVDPGQTTFELYISRKVTGDLISAFCQSRSPDEAKAALEKARDELWGKAPGYTKRGLLADSLARYVNAVLKIDNAQVIPIIINLGLVCGSGSPQGDLEAVIGRGPVSQSKVFDIADKMCGWVKRQADKQLERASPAVILRDDFHREYLAYVRSVDRETILKSMVRRPSDAERQERLSDTFVQQLNLIELSFDDKLEAVSDFLRACWDRAMWSKLGDVHENSFAELDDNLLRSWRNHNRAVGVEAASKLEVEQGQLLHTRCMSHPAKVQGMEPPSHFVPGCFHRLADDKVIGWHPTYRELLAKAVAEAS